jgi:ribosomal protein L22
LWTPEESAEAVVRRYRDLLKRKDQEICSNLEQGNYAKARELFELRRTGKLEQRLKGYISGIKSVSKSEMQESPEKSADLLEELSREALELKSILEKLAH